MGWEGQRPSGRGTEERVQGVLDALPVVRRSSRTKRNGRLDRIGVDLTVELNPVPDQPRLTSVGVQVKSSLREVVKFVRKKGGPDELIKRRIVVLDGSKAEDVIAKSFLEDVEAIRRTVSKKGSQ